MGFKRSTEVANDDEKFEHSGDFWRTFVCFSNRAKIREHTEVHLCNTMRVAPVVYKIK